MIRFIVGLILVLGAVGNEDFALEMGTAAPPLIHTVLLSVVGLGLMLSAVPKLSKL